MKTYNVLAGFMGIDDVNDLGTFNTIREAWIATEEYIKTEEYGIRRASLNDPSFAVLWVFPNEGRWVGVETSG